MSEENVETVSRGVEALNRRDAEAIVGMCDPDVEWKTELIGTPVYRGHEGIRQALRDIDRAWESWHTEPVELLAGDEMVFLATRAAARARDTGIPVEADLFYAVTFRDAKIVRCEGFSDRSKALEAAGLSE
jgi:ketosteroid isomerase-like protein